MSAPASARASAIACPIPRVPPVMSAVLPSSENILMIDSMVGVLVDLARLHTVTCDAPTHSICMLRGYTGTPAGCKECFYPTTLKDLDPEKVNLGALGSSPTVVDLLLQLQLLYRQLRRRTMLASLR